MLFHAAGLARSLVLLGWISSGGTPRPEPTLLRVAAAEAGSFPGDSGSPSPHRLPLLVSGYVLHYGALYSGLAASWYTGQKVPLHWLNDLPE